MTPEEIAARQKQSVEIPPGLTTLVEPVFGPPNPEALASRDALLKVPVGLGGVTDPEAARVMGGSYNALSPEVINKMWKG